MTFLKYLSIIISWTFLPFVVPVFGLYITLFLPSETIFLEQSNMFKLEDELKDNIMSVYALFSVIAPSISYISLKKRGIISSLEMENKDERYIPILIMMSYCLVMFTLFYIKDPHHILPHFIVSLPLSGAIVALIIAFVNNFIKLSLHLAGIGIVVGYLIAFNASHAYSDPKFVIIAIFLSGLLAAARLILKKHTLLEVSFGWIIAVSLSFLTNFFYESIF